ncbi:MAG TPA: adenylate/guanylate cyclase domain-containing protein [Gaiellaceae bacterium]|nr:adenylate/guanylate cyclase domain-containing protein [Gaiellaceae bacterium]
MICPSCETENRAGARFCRQCGASLAEHCPDCGAPVEPGQRFCDGCGRGLAAPAPPAARPEPVAERRLVSVLFADLVGFTTLSESRDAEEVRELLSRYFDTCRRLVERYGGVVEKFIGDAVMAVWGTPTANEDDAERAVRTALDLVAAVSGLADELGAGDLRLRAGVLTGEAAVTVGALGEGMVAGDLVNTASRIQAEAEPGTVLVGDATRRATEAAIAYEDAGFHHLKGKTEPQRLHRALRVIAARRGEGRAAGLEPPFVGRQREFALVKDLFHACAEERRARLVSIVGVAGIGKSRLSWEFEKYVDGLADEVRWHRGRCLAYGDGVAYWALAEMVRMRARIAEEDAPEAALAKLRESLAAVVPSVDERTFLEPRLAHLLGLAVRSAPDKEDLFSAWRLFFERMAEQAPVALVFEDLQWADAGLLDFVEYLLDWSRAHPIFVLTLARPELAERRSDWGAGRRAFTSLFLEPLSPDEVDALLHGLAPGLPAELRARIVERAEGVPLYAVETVRMLLDRGLLVRSGDEYRPAGPIETLAIPETLHALAAARLDSLEREERRLLEDAAVLGRSFTRHGLAELAGAGEAEIEPTLQSLLRKEILSIQADPLSPEQNQISFVQDLLRRVAYETLSVRSRKDRHLAAAAHLEREGDDELAAVIAAHYLDAYRAAAGDQDADELRTQARAALTRAGERASSLASAAAAAQAFAQAAELADDPLEQSHLLERAGLASLQDGKLDEASARLARVAELVEASGLPGALRIAARRAEVFRAADRVSDAVELLAPVYAAAPKDEPDPEVALAAAELARAAYFGGDRVLAAEAVETALEMAEALALPAVLAEALTTKGILVWRRPHESLALLKEGLAVAREHDLARSALRAQFNLSGMLIEHDRIAEARREIEAALVVSRQRGNRDWEQAALGQLSDALVLLGEWEEAVSVADAAQEGQALGGSIGLSPAIRIRAERGDLAGAQALLAARAEMRTSSDLQARASLLEAAAVVLRHEGRYAEAIASAEESLDIWRSIGEQHYAIEALAEAAESAFALGDLERVEGFLREVDAWPLIERRPLLAAQGERIRAKLAAARREPASAEFARAADLFRELELPFWTAVTLLEDAESRADPEEAAPLFAEAEAIFGWLGAVPWLERLRARTPVV